jgi:hypothetical protein
MGNRLEDRIRDYLADHLEMLGDGLSLVEKEHVLPNPSGTGGRMDILARDKFGIFTVIEIKRSDEAARQTLNEIHKYTALLRIQQGLDETQVRVMIVSTDWNELRLPLSECAEVFPYAVEPFAIKALPDGTVTQVERVQLIPKTGIIRLSRVQGSYCFRNKNERDAALPILVDAATKAALSDFVILKLNYGGTSQAVCFPFSLYFLFTSPLLNATPAELKKIKAQVEWDDTLDQPDENFLVAVMNSFVGSSDDFEMGYPEKLTTILQDWTIAEVSRHGRLAANHSLLSDADVMSLAQALEGGSPIYICKLCSPKLSAAWAQLQSDLKSTLRGMPEWEKIVPLFLEEIQSESPMASVSAYVFNPTNLLMSLYPVAWANDFSKCPHLEVVVEDDTKKQVRLMVSLLAWNGKPVKETPDGIVNRIYGSIIKWIAAQHFHETHIKEAAMLRAHNFVAPLVEFIYREKGNQPPRRLAKSGKRLSRKPFNLDSVKDLAEFSAGNKKYLQALKSFLESHTIGLPGSDLMQGFNTANE